MSSSREVTSATRLAGLGAVAGATAGILWAFFYWREHTPFAATLVVVHAAAGIAFGVLVHLAGRLSPRIPSLSATGFIGAAVGVLWLAPILLFLIDYQYFDIRVNAAGVLATASLLAATALAGALLGSLASARGPALSAAFVGGFGLVGPILSFLVMPGVPAPKVSIVDRVGTESVDRGERPPRRVMVLGVDGASWNAVTPLLNEGRLPHLRRLMEGGRYGILESIESPSGGTASPVVWTSIFSGMLPENHGITDWLVSDSRNRTSKTLWNILNDHGDRTIVVNVPGTFPPEVVDGAMISGFPIPGVARPSSSRFLVSEGRLYTNGDGNSLAIPTSRIEVRPATAISSRATATSFSPPRESILEVAEAVEAQYGILRHRAYDFRIGNLFFELFERRGLVPAQRLAEFFVLLVDTTDDARVNHDSLLLFARAGDAEPLAVLREGDWSKWLTVRFKGADLYFKLRAIQISPELVEVYATPLFQSSARPVVPFTYPPSLGSHVSSALGQYVVEGAGWVMSANDVLRDPLYEHVHDVADKHLDASLFLVSEVPEWTLLVHLFTESDRIQHAFWKFHEPDAYPHVDPGSVRAHGNKVRATLEAVDARIGELLAHADDDTIVVVVSDHGFRASPAVGRGEHSNDGVFVFSGRGVAPAPLPLNLDVDTYARASAVDVAPTILYLMGYPVAEDMDGRALVELASGEHESCCPLRVVETYGRGLAAGESPRQILDDSTLEQLKSLGYVP